MTPHKSLRTGHILDLFFGYDYFIAHRSVDGKPYAAALYDALTSEGNELTACLADLKRSEALKTSHAPEIRKYLEQLNSAQRDILNRLRTLPTSPAGGVPWSNAWPGARALALGLLLIGFLVGMLIESSKENDRLTSVIRSLPYSMQATALL